MSSKKISQLPAAGALDGTEEFAINQSGLTSKVTLDEVKTFTQNNINELVVHIDSAAILTSGVSLVELIPPPGVGKFLHNMCVTVKKNYNGIAYATNVFCPFVMNMLELKGGFKIDFTQDTYEYTPSIYSDGDINDIENQALKFYTQTGNPTAGDGTLDFYITYQILDL